MRVEEMMNQELFCVLPDARADETAHCLRSLGVHAAPVVDGASGKPMGVLSISDATSRRSAGARARDRMSAPAATVRDGDTVQGAAMIMATSGRHHLVVVGQDGEAVGFISAVDVIRSLLGLPVADTSSSSSFPRYAPETGHAWIDDTLGQSTHPCETGGRVSRCGSTP